MTIWARVGMSVDVTEEQYEEIKQMAKNKEASEAYGYDIYEDLEDLPDWLVEKFENEGVMDGDTYIPSECW